MGAKTYVHNAVYVDLGQPCEEPRGDSGEGAASAARRRPGSSMRQEELCRDFAFPFCSGTAKIEGM